MIHNPLLFTIYRRRFARRPALLMTTTDDIATSIAEERRERRFAGGEATGLLEECRDLAAYRHLLRSLVVRDLTVRYKRSFIGFLWTMLNPLLLMIIFVIIFSELFRFKIVHYDIYFLSAYIGWNFFAQSTVGAMASLGWNGQLMKQVRAPKTIFALATTISGLVNLVLSMFPLLLIMWWVKAPIRISILFLPISFVVLAMFTLGVSLAVSSISVFFVDVREMYTVGLTALMYLTPIIYPLDIIPEKFLWVVKPNPLRYMLETIRAPIYYGIIPPMRTVLLALGCSVGALVVGWSIFRRLSPRFYAHL